MYLVERDKNRITEMKVMGFSELGFNERSNLQEWIAYEPGVLGEPLLIIQKEFDGFDDTKERPDLLALDKQQNLVVIENKLDDSGRDVTWQSLKYASYCSTMSKEDIREVFGEYLLKIGSKTDPQIALSEFYELPYEDLTLNQGSTQRIILVAAKFRKEVTSTVLWLMNFNLRIQCFKATVFKKEEQIFLNLEQILPVQDTEDFMIRMAAKAQDEIANDEKLKGKQKQNREFWTKFLEASRAKAPLFADVNASKDPWLTGSIGMTGVTLYLYAAPDSCRAEILISKGDKELNGKCFDFLLESQAEIEKTYGGQLNWDRQDNLIQSRISDILENVSVARNEDWSRMIEFLVDRSGRLEQAFKKPVAKLNAQVKGRLLDRIVSGA